jgi:hypothetical protein
VAILLPNANHHEILFDPSPHCLDKLILGESFEVNLIFREIIHHFLLGVINLKRFGFVA